MCWLWYSISFLNLQGKMKRPTNISKSKLSDVSDTSTEEPNNETKKGTKKGTTKKSTKARTSKTRLLALDSTSEDDRDSVSSSVMNSTFNVDSSEEETTKVKENKRPSRGNKRSGEMAFKVSPFSFRKKLFKDGS